MLNSQQTKQRIKSALLDLMLVIDADKITAVDLARKAGVSRATLYRYYASVDDTLREMQDEYLEGMRDSSRYYISAPFDLKQLDKPYPAFVSVAEYIKEHAQFFLVMTGAHGDARFVHKWHKYIQEFYHGKLAYEGLVVRDSDFYTVFVMAGNDAVIRHWLEKHPEITAEELAPIIQKILYGPYAC